jgi:hypothetical protein
MTIPYNDDTRETYLQRIKENHLHWAKKHCELGNDFSMWQQLFTWVQVEEIYGGHWENYRAENNK